MMTNKKNQAGFRNSDEEILDHVLDHVLRQYSAVEPRAGLEARILANLRAERLQASGRAWWQWGLVGAVAVAALAAGITWRANRTRHHAIANHPPTAIQQPLDQGTKVVARSRGESVRKRAPTHRSALHRVPLAVAVIVSPKLDQFPSRQPLSEEEVALAQYVREFPKEAALIAQAQDEYEKEVQRDMKGPNPAIGTAGSDQQQER